MLPNIPWEKNVLQLRITVLGRRKKAPGSSNFFVCFCFSFVDLGSTSQKPLNGQVFIKLILWLFVLPFANPLGYLFISFLIISSFYFLYRISLKIIVKCFDKICFSSVTLSVKETRLIWHDMLLVYQFYFFVIISSCQYF